MNTNPTTPASVGLVETRLAKLPLPPEGFRLVSGACLPELQVAYETYGALAPARDNVVFICHALSGDAHVAGHHGDPVRTAGWWDEMVGPGKGIDTRYYHVVCANILGGCKGTTGPGSTDPRTGRPYGSSFPRLTVADIVNAHVALLDHLGIERVAAVVGGSFGGMQTLEWAIRYPDRVDRCVCIASAARLSAQALAFDIVGREAILGDPDWQGGDYYGTGRAPAAGLATARKIGHITYLSPDMMTRKFGRERREEPIACATGADAQVDARAPFRTNFQVESYLDYQGRKFVQRFDANAYLHITRAMDEYDLAARAESLEAAFAPLRARVLVVALSSDWLFPPEQSQALAHALLRAGKDVSYCELQAPHGHDAFLVDIRHLADAIGAFLPWVAGVPPTSATPPPASAAPRAPGRDSGSEYQAIAGMIPRGARVLDLGCGDGALLDRLRADRAVRGMGVDIEVANVIRVLDRGHAVFQGDMDAGLAMLPDRAWDCAILGETLQVVRKPRLVLHALLRVAREGIVTFPNFGLVAHRLRLGLGGRMPQTRTLPYTWYDTPNIHLFTLQDFLDLCRQDHIRVLDRVCLPAGAISRLFCRLGCCNIGADRVILRLTRE